MKQGLRHLFVFLGNSYLAARSILGRLGKGYGITRLQKLRLVIRMVRCRRRVRSLTTLQQQLVLVWEILGIPPSLEGDVVECGCYNGASTVSLSLACELTGRRLFVCDSFEGLPEPEKGEKHEVHDDVPEHYIWEKGEFSSSGGLEGVRKNVERFGQIGVCRFVKGFYSDSLQGLETDSIVMVFEDADLASSVQDCIMHLWPKLQYGCKFFCHEPWSPQVIGLFYDKRWWDEQLHADPPGFHGSGGGVIAGFRPCTMGYATKFDADAVRRGGTKLVQCGTRGFDIACDPAGHGT